MITFPRSPRILTLKKKKKGEEEEETEARNGDNPSSTQEAEKGKSLEISLGNRGKLHLKNNGIARINVENYFCRSYQNK